MNDIKITPLSKLIQEYNDKTGFSYSKLGNWIDKDDAKQTLKNFCEEENKIIKDYVDGKICELTLWDLRREAKLKHFGELA